MAVGWTPKGPITYKPREVLPGVTAPPPGVIGGDTGIGQALLGGKGGTIISGGGGGGGTSTQQQPTPAATKPITPTQEVQQLAERAATRLGKSVRDVTRANLTSQQAYETRELRTKAGTFGKNLGPLVEQKKLREFIKAEEVKAQSKAEPRDYFLTAKIPPKTKYEKFVERTKSGISNLRKGNILQQAAAGVAYSGISNIEFARALATSPRETIKNIPAGIKQTYGMVKSGELLSLVKSEPAFVTGAVIGEVGLGKGITKGLKGAGKVATNVITKLDPRFIPVTTKAGQRAVEGIPLQNKRLVLELTEPGDFKGIPLREQAAFAGQKGLDVATAQRDLFGTLIGRTKVIEKPTLPGQSPLERSLFVSPPTKSGTTQLRISRLGLQAQREARLKDILSGDITFKRQGKPQAIIFENVDVDKIPSELIPNLKKAFKGDPQSLLDFEREYLKFQLKPTGKFKAIGFPGTREPEFTLAPGEIVRRRKTAAVTLINGNRVPIITAEVVKASKRTQDLISKLKLNKISSNELIELRKRLTKESRGLDYSSPVKAKPYFSPSRLIRKPPIYRPRIRRTPIRPSIRRQIIPRRIIPNRITPRRITPTRIRTPLRPYTPITPRRITPRMTPSRIITPRVRTPFIRPPVKRPPQPSFKRGLKKPSKPSQEQGYLVLYKSRGRFNRINKVPVTRQQALDLGADVSDKSLANTFRLIKTKRKIGNPDLTIRSGYFQRTQNKFRPYRIVKGQKIGLVNTFIEKRGKARIDTLSEKKKLQAAAYISRLKRNTFGTGLKKLKSYSGLRRKR